MKKIFSSKLFFMMFFIWSFTALSYENGYGDEINGIIKRFETTYDYDALDRLIATYRPDGSIIKYEYDNTGHVISIKVFDGTNESVTRFKYDKNGNQIEASNEYGETEYFYDPLNQLEKVSYDYPALQKSIKYQYDPWGRRRHVSIYSDLGAQEYSVKYDYDMHGQLINLNVNGTNIKYEYNPTLHSVKRTLPNDIWSEYKYNGIGKIKELNHFVGDSNIASFKYDYNPVGSINSYLETLGDKTTETSFTYNESGRLSSASFSDKNMFEYNYDKTGMLNEIKTPTELTKIHKDTNGLYSELGGDKYSYNDLGIVTQIESPSYKREFKYDSFNRLTEIKTPNETVKYSYSADGFRIGSQVGNKKYQMLPDPHSIADKPFLISSNDFKEISPTRDLSLLNQKNDLRLNIYDPHRNKIASIGMDQNIQKYSQPPKIEFDPIKIPDVKVNPYNGFKSKSTDLSRNQSMQKFPTSPRIEFEPIRMPDPFEIHHKANSFDQVNKNVWDSVGMGQTLPMPSMPEIKSYNIYWENGQYLNSNYYRMLTNTPEISIKPVNPIVDHYNKQMTLPIGDTVLKNNFDVYQGLVNYHLSNPGFSHQLQGYLWAGLSSIGYATSEVAFGGLVRNFTKLTSPISSPIKRIEGLVLGMLDIPGISPPGTKYIGQKVGLNLAKEIIPFGTKNRIVIASAGKFLSEMTYKNVAKKTIEKTFDSIDNLGMKFKPKGVKFDKPAKFIGNIGAIKGVSFDSKSKRLTLIGDLNSKLPELRLDDFAIAVKILYSGDITGHEYPQFSLEPVEPANPSGKWLEPVFFPDILAGTHMGDVMFKADWILKNYTFGLIADENGKVLGKRSSSVAGYKSYMQLVKENMESFSGHVTSRFWILPLEMVLERVGDTVIFKKAKMQVQSRRMEVAGGALVDSSSKSDPIAQTFSQFFTRNYDLFAKETPILEEVREAAKVVAIVKWLKDQGVGINDYQIDWDKIKCQENYVKRIHTLSLTEVFSAWGMGSTKLRLVGGVELRPEYKITPTTPNVSSICESFNYVRNNKFSTSVEQFRVQHTPYITTVLPITQGSSDFCKTHPTVVHEGITYAADARKRVRTMLDRYGNSTTFDYNEKDELSEICAVNNNNWVMNAAMLENEYQEIRLHSPVNDLHTYLFSDKGDLKEVRINDELTSKITETKNDDTSKYVMEYFTTVKSRPAIGDLTGKPSKISKVVCREIITRSGKGAQYTRETMYDNEHKVENVNFTYNDKTIEIKGDNFGKVTIRNLDKNKVVIENILGDILYNYDEKTGLLKKIQYENGDFIEFLPDASTSLRIKKGENIGEITSEKDFVKINDLNGRETIYRYANGLLNKVEFSEGKSIKYSYDKKNNHLQTVEMPDGSKHRYELICPPGAGTSRLTFWKEL